MTILYALLVLLVTMLATTITSLYDLTIYLFTWNARMMLALLSLLIYKFLLYRLLEAKYLLKYAVLKDMCMDMMRWYNKKSYSLKKIYIYYNLQPRLAEGSKTKL